MKIVSMNICGFGGLTKQKSLKSLFATLNPDMIMLQETMSDHFSALSMFSKMRHGWEFCALNSQGLFGGLLMGWNPLLIRCKAFQSYADILVKSRFKGLESILSILNVCGTYSIRVFFWDNVLGGVS